jgi:hypothetical protein
MKIYKDVRNVTNSSVTTTLVRKNKDGNVLLEKDKYWKDGNNTLTNY